MMRLKTRVVVILLAGVITSLGQGCDGFTPHSFEKTIANSLEHHIDPEPQLPGSPGENEEESPPLPGSSSCTDSSIPAARRTVNVSSTDDWCAIVKAAQPGDHVVFAPGFYSRACRIETNGTAAAPIVLRSQDPSNKAVFNYGGTASNLFDIYSVYTIFHQLAFKNTAAGVVTLRINKGHDITVQQCLFDSMGSNTITANRINPEPFDRIILQENTFTRLKAAPVYLGCSNGTDCTATNFVVQRNFIDGRDINDPGIVGYGMEFKPNSYGIIQDNAVYFTQGPGIMVFGSNKGVPANIIRGNYVEGSRNDAGINVGGGPARVYNNILVGNAYGGIYAQNYGGRNWQKDINIVNNTLINNKIAGIVTQAWQNGVGNLIALNAILPLGGTPAIQPATSLGQIFDNVTCGTDCFASQPTTAPYIFTPSSTGPLVTGGAATATYDKPTFDFFGITRGPSDSTRGAIVIDPETAGLTVGGLKTKPCK
ncbi:MAG: right-handed parallel beta-helix repeat-containing protein [Bdellovibrionales bacterium]